MVKKGIKTEFQEKWVDRYGLRVIERDELTSKVLSVCCRFCETSGRRGGVEESLRKRRRTENFKYFKPPWRSDNITRHLKDQHPEEYKAYESYKREDKNAFFLKFETQKIEDEDLLVVNDDDKFLIAVDRDIVEILVGELLWDDVEDELHGGISGSDQATSVFQLQQIQQEKKEEEGRMVTSTVYIAKIGNETKFDLVVAHIGSGSTIRLCTRIIETIKEMPEMPSIGRINEAKVISYIRYVCGLNFQTLRRILQSTWAFSLAIDGEKKDYLDIQLQFCAKGSLRTFHLVSLPQWERHTSEAIFDYIQRFFDVLCPKWRKKLIGLASDGVAAGLMRTHHEMVRFLHPEPTDGFYRVWCDAHRLDLLAQSICDTLYDETFLQAIIGMSCHLRQQTNLIQEMKSKCPRFIDTHWSSMKKLLDWFMKNSVRLYKWYDGHQIEGVTPSKSTWIMIFILQRYIDEVSVVLNKLRTLTLLVGHQKEHLQNLAINLKSIGGVEGPLEAGDGRIEIQTSSIEEAMLCPDNIIHTQGGFFITYKTAKKILFDQENFIVDLLHQVEFDSSHEFMLLIRNIALLYINSVAGIATIIAEREDNDDSSESRLPPVTPKSLLGISRTDFGTIIRKQRTRLSCSFDDVYIAEIEREFFSLQNEYRREAHLKKRISSMRPDVSFNVSWRSILSSYPKLHNFIGGLASIFPGKRLDNEDNNAFFSPVTHYEKNEYSQSMINFSLEGILHCRQYNAIKELKTLV